MLNLNKPIIIVGSGNSVPFLNSRHFSNGFKRGIEPKLEYLIKGNYSIGLNHFFAYGECTFTSFVDPAFYEDNYDKLKREALIIGHKDPSLQRHKYDITHPNTILLKSTNGYKGIHSFSEGFYSRQLVGIWVLTLAIALGFKEIYLLGYDCKEINGRTHFYQGVVDLNEKRDLMVLDKKVGETFIYRGVGKKPEDKKGTYNTSTYDRPKNLNNQWFKPFLKEKDIKIYNVSPDSAIELFEKITYEEFYSKVPNNHIVQSEARETIRQIIYKKLEMK
ncbi:hypothetical protein LCGC14_1934100 [marine sediment metagenome]|uniref:DUF115 domain-containing protein n=1 Tax=marine sediment metagenome TaxID=412755 RepID=A0A0F9FM89_9ZZZZ